MCGLLGWDLSKINLSSERRAMMAAVLTVGNDSRGGDSWGFHIPGGETVRGLGNMASSANKLVPHTRVLGHTRKATTGGISVENAHPYEIGSIIGAHNGIITNHYQLNNKYERNYAVDSMHIFGHLNEGRDLTDLNGYGAIEWVRKEKPNRIFLCKLSGGDLSIVGIGKNSKQVKGVVWSSNDDHVLAALRTARLEHFEYKVETGVVYYIQDGCLYVSNQKLSLSTSNSWSSYPDWRHGHTSSYYNQPEASEKVTTSKSSGTADETVGLTTEEKQFLELWEQEELARNSLLAQSLKDDEFEELFDRQLNEGEKIEFPSPSENNKVLSVITPKNGGYVEKFYSGIGWVKCLSDGTMIDSKSGKAINENMAK